MNHHDYIIKNGQLVGDFEGLYENFEDPWEQSKREIYAFEKLIGIELLKKYNHKLPIELGCGHGHYSNKIYQEIGNCTGVDISKKAIDKAKDNYKNCIFVNSDITNEKLYENVDCIMMIEITWYILPQLNNFKKLIKEKLSNKNVGFFHTLNIYPEGQQKYGNDFFTNLEEIKEYFCDTIDILEFGQISRKDYEGCSRTFIYGKIN